MLVHSSQMHGTRRFFFLFHHLFSNHLLSSYVSGAHTSGGILLLDITFRRYGLGGLNSIESKRAENNVSKHNRVVFSKF